MRARVIVILVLLVAFAPTVVTGSCQQLVRATLQGVDRLIGTPVAPAPAGHRSVTP